MYAVIMAGGKGTRFWPISREDCPKQLLNIIGEKALLQQTVERLSPLIDPSRILVVTEHSLLASIRDLLPQIPLANFIVEPQGKDTAPCVALAALYIQKRKKESIMAVLPADHWIEAPTDFLEFLAAARDFVEQRNGLVTLGIQPTRPETGYGYIQIGSEIGVFREKRVFQVERFVEKPDIKQAQKFYVSQEYLWNSGMFLWSAETILGQIEIHLPNVFEGMKRIATALGTSQEERVNEQVFADMEAISIDKGVLEKASEVVVLPADFGWNDVGSWQTLSDLLPADEAGNTVHGKVILIDTRNCLVHNPRKLVATIGLKDLIIVETEDAILVCPKERDQEVRDIVEALKRKEWTKYL